MLRAHDDLLLYTICKNIYFILFPGTFLVSSPLLKYGTLFPFERVLYLSAKNWIEKKQP